jgi:hypothetical protein
MTTEVRKLLDLAADRVAADPSEAPVAAVLAAGRRRTSRRRVAALGGAAGVAAAVAAGVLGAQLAEPGAAGGPAALLGGGGDGDTVCGGVRFDRAQLPGRPLQPGDRFGTTAELADLLRLHGWPRAVPYDAAVWTVLTGRGDALLVARRPDGDIRYLPVRRQRDGSWAAEAPCTPRPLR